MCFIVRMGSLTVIDRIIFISMFQILMTPSLLTEIYLPPCSESSLMELCLKLTVWKNPTLVRVSLWLLVKEREKNNPQISLCGVVRMCKFLTDIAKYVCRYVSYWFGKKTKIMTLKIILAMLCYKSHGGLRLLCKLHHDFVMRFDVLIISLVYCRSQSIFFFMRNLIAAFIFAPLWVKTMK